MASSLTEASESFDPRGAVRFDVRSGHATDARGARLVVLPAAALDALDRAHPGAAAVLGAELGSAVGARVAARLGGDAGVRGASLEKVVTHLAGELAVAGLGAVHVERWGRALVCVVGGAVASDAFVGSAVGAALAGATGRSASAAALGRDATVARFFVGSPETAAKVGAAVAGGRAFAEVLASIQGAA